ncbi:MAG: BrnT family toxin [Desulfobulbaceae bacterium]
MQYEWDDGKRAANGGDFLEAEQFERSSALEVKDDRIRYGEERWIALGLIGKRLHELIYTRRRRIIRLISLRRANKRKKEYYEKTQA